jgi:hypothetical protein
LPIFKPFKTTVEITYLGSKYQRDTTFKSEKTYLENLLDLSVTDLIQSSHYPSSYLDPPLLRASIPNTVSDPATVVGLVSTGFMGDGATPGSAAISRSPSTLSVSLKTSHARRSCAVVELTCHMPRN